MSFMMFAHPFPARSTVALSFSVKGGEWLRLLHSVDSPPVFG